MNLRTFVVEYNGAAVSLMAAFGWLMAACGWLMAACGWLALLEIHFEARTLRALVAVCGSFS